MFYLIFIHGFCPLCRFKALILGIFNFLLRTLTFKYFKVSPLSNPSYLNNIVQNFVQFCLLVSQGARTREAIGFVRSNWAHWSNSEREREREKKTRLNFICIAAASPFQVSLVVPGCISLSQRFESHIGVFHIFINCYKLRY